MNALPSPLGYSVSVKGLRSSTAPRALQASFTAPLTPRVNTDTFGSRCPFSSATLLAFPRNRRRSRLTGLKSSIIAALDRILSMDTSRGKTARFEPPETPPAASGPPPQSPPKRSSSFWERTTYPYSPLSSSRNEIRLLKLYPARSRLSPIRCSLFATPLETAPSYVALSYAWGKRSGRDVAEIFSEGSEGNDVVGASQGVVGITANLKCALVMLRQTQKASSDKEVLREDNGIADEDEYDDSHTESRRKRKGQVPGVRDDEEVEAGSKATPAPLFLWVDAICINQFNIPERSLQTSNMREIYQRAESVAVWLGGEERGSAEAIQLVRDFNLAEQKSPSMSQTVRDIILDESRKEHLASLVTLFRRQYWWRIWVIQEVCVARSTIVYCGTDSISWTDLDNVCTILKNEEPALRTIYYQHHSHIRTLTHGGPRGLQLSRYSPTSVAPPLHELLLSHKSKNATDPKDKVYALVGISSSRHTFGPIDYSLSMRSLYAHTARHIITSTKQLDIICVKQHDGNKYGLPSWVPDWTRRVSGFTVIGLHHHEPPFAAAGKSVAEVEFLGDYDNAVKARGVVVDHVKRLGRLFKRRGKPSEIALPLNALRYWWTVFNEERPEDENMWKIFGTIVSCGNWDWAEDEFNRRLEGVWRLADRMMPAMEGGLDRTPTGFTDLGRAGTGFSDISRRSTGFSDEDPGEGEGDGQDLTASVISTSLQTVEFDEEKEHMATILSAGLTMNRRRLFFSPNGLVGLVPWNAEEGDLLVILFGCKVPVVLRWKEDDGYYIVIGEAYVYGCMDGEIIGRMEREGLAVTEFEIH